MKPWHWIIIVVFVIVIAFAIYAINQAQKPPKVIVTPSANQKSDMWSVIDGILGLLSAKKKAKEEEEKVLDPTDPYFVGPLEA